MKKKVNRLYIKIFFAIIPLLIILTAIPSAIITRQVGGVLELESQTLVAQTIHTVLPYLQSGEISRDAFSEFFPGTSYRIQWYSDRYSVPVALDHPDLSEPHSLKIVNKRDYDGRFLVVFRCGNEYATIHVDLLPTLKKIAHVDNRIRSLSLVINILAFLYVGRRLFRPIMTVEQAAKSVASGDFSVRVPIRKHQDELSSLINSFNAMAQELGNVEMLRTGFISDVSHEFKIPLTTISGYTKLLQTPCSPEEQKEYTQIIVEETAHLSTLVDNILILNRLEKHGGSIPPEPVFLAEEIRRALAQYEPVWSAKELDVAFSLEELLIEGHGVLLFHVWTNLIDNAIKFSPIGGKIQLALTQWGDGGVCFEISDSGCGIEWDQQKRIFDKFYKGDHSRNTEGNGLGLSIAHRIVEIHGGSIDVYSNPGEGTRFAVRLKHRSV